MRLLTTLRRRPGQRRRISIGHPGDLCPGTASKNYLEGCGQTQHYLLLESFNRRRLVGGRFRCCGWSANEESAYRLYRQLIDKRFIVRQDSMDLGAAGDIRAGEILWCQGSWQLFKGIGRPYKSVFS